VSELEELLFAGLRGLQRSSLLCFSALPCTHESLHVLLCLCVQDGRSPAPPARQPSRLGRPDDKVAYDRGQRYPEPS
jgi:hypothetical protein